MFSMSPLALWRCASRGTASALTALGLIGSMLFLVAAPVQARSDQDNALSIALIIANQDYDFSADVAYAQRDAAAVKAFLIQRLGFTERRIHVVNNMTTSLFKRWFGHGQAGSGRRDFGRLSRLARPGRSNVFVYYVGHGAPDPRTNERFVIPTDVDAARPSDGFAFAQMRATLDHVAERIGPQRRVILMMDACFSGESHAGSLTRYSAPAFKPLHAEKDDAQRGKPSNLISLAASTSAQVAGWDPEAGHSIFTAKFIAGVEGAADRDGNGDGTVSWPELKEFVEFAVNERSLILTDREQNPIITDQPALPWAFPANALEIAYPDGGPQSTRSNDASQAGGLTEREQYDLASRLGTVKALNLYLERFPEGRYKQAVQLLLEKARAEEARLSAPGETARCRTAFQDAQKLNSAAALDAFARAYENCPQAPLAREYANLKRDQEAQAKREAEERRKRERAQREQDRQAQALLEEYRRKLEEFRSQPAAPRQPTTRTRPSTRTQPTAPRTSAKSCGQLWYERNAIYHRYGYCFKGARGRSTFGNRGCSRSDAQARRAMGAANRRRVDALRREERRRGC